MIDVLKDWLGLVAILISVGGAIYAVMTAGSKANAKRLDGMSDRMNGHGNRIHDLETEIKHMPDKDAVNELKLSVVKLEGTVGIVAESLDGMSKVVARIDGYLRDSGK